MLKIFIDSDIILDLLAKREPHYIHSAKLFALIDRNKISAHTSPLVFANLHYILRKSMQNEQVLKNLRKLKSLVRILPIDEKIIELSLSSDLNDFENAIQYHTAKTIDIKFLITRNKKDYDKADITICTAEEFLIMLRSLEASTEN